MNDDLHKRLGLSFAAVIVLIGVLFFATDALNNARHKELLKAIKESSK